MRPEPPLVFHPSSLADLPLDLVIDRIDGGLGDEDGYLITLRDVRRGLQFGFRPLERAPRRRAARLARAPPSSTPSASRSPAPPASLDAGPGPDERPAACASSSSTPATVAPRRGMRRVGADPPQVLDTGAAEGDVADCLRRALGLPTPPPPCGPVAWWAVDWLDAVLDAVCRDPARRVDLGARCRRLHPLLGSAPARQPRGADRAGRPGAARASTGRAVRRRVAAEGEPALPDRSRAGGLDGRRDVRPVAPRLPARPGRRGGRSRRPAAADGHPRRRRGAPGMGLLVSRRRSDRPPTLAVWRSRSINGYADLTAIGQGGFAVVYRAEQSALNRSVAVKVLSGLVDPVAISRFERECATIGSLSGHPHVVSVYDAGTTVEGSPYLAMEYLPAGLAGRPGAGERAAPDAEILRVGVQLCDALEAAHRAGVLHRDIKPENVLRRRGRRVQAGRLRRGCGDRGGRQPRHRARARSLGTVLHLAPEVLEGGRARSASDIYSLGSTLATPRARQGPVLAHRGRHRHPADDADRPRPAARPAGGRASPTAWPPRSRWRWPRSPTSASGRPPRSATRSSRSSAHRRAGHPDAGRATDAPARARRAGQRRDGG